MLEITLAGFEKRPPGGHIARLDQLTDASGLNFEFGFLDVSTSARLMTWGHRLRDYLISRANVVFRQAHPHMGTIRAAADETLRSFIAPVLNSWRF